MGSSLHTRPPSTVPSPTKSASESEASDDSASFIDEDTLRLDLEICLDDLPSAGDFALFEPLPRCVVPGLWVKGVGSIGFPLSASDAQAIIGASREAPYGKGSETLVDAKIRKTWELAPHSLEIRNPGWQQVVDEVLQRLLVGMGIQTDSGGVKAELYKMLLYDQGAMFKPHQDSEKAPGMFGTLVICLPSKHDGGEVKITHMGHTKIFETAKYSEFGTSFMSWFSDVIHEIKPVTSGYRLVLTYNLCYSRNVHESGSTALEASTRLTRLITSWTTAYEAEQVKCPEIIAYKLEHQYTNANLSLNALKGHDRVVVKHLEVVSMQTGCCIYIANLVKMVEGYCEEDYYDDDYNCYGYCNEGYHEMAEECDASIKLSHIVNLNGTRVAGDISIEADEIIQSGMFEDREPDEEDYQGYTGNEGSSVTHYYRDTVAIIIPRGGRVPVFLSQRRNTDCNSQSIDTRMKTWFNNLSDTAENDPSDMVAEAELIHMCKLVISDLKKQPLSPYMTLHSPSKDVIELALKTAIELARKQIFVDLLAYMSNNISPSVSLLIGKGVALFGFESMKYSLNTIITRCSSFESRYSLLDSIRESFKASKLPSHFSKRASKAKPKMPVSGTEALSSQIEPLEPNIDLWINERLEEGLRECTMCSKGDGRILVEVSTLLGTRFLYNNILPRVKRNATNKEMVISFMLRLLIAGEDNKISRNIALSVFRDTLQDVLDNFSLGPNTIDDVKRLKTEHHEKWTHGARESALPAASEATAETQDMANLVATCLSQGYLSEVDLMFSKIIADAQTIAVGLFQSHVLPFLKVLIRLSLARKIDLSTHRFRLLFQHVLCSYIDRYVKSEPIEPKDWSRRPRGCGCSSCREFDYFLCDPLRQIQCFSRNPSYRKHLEGRLQPSPCDYTWATDKSRSPHTLIVKKKAGKIPSFRVEHTAWQKRADAAKKLILDLDVGDDALKKLLGDRREAIIGMGWLKAGAAEAGVTNPVSNCPNLRNGLSRGSGNKTVSGNRRQMGAGIVHAKARGEGGGEGEDIEVIIIDD